MIRAPPCCKHRSISWTGQNIIGYDELTMQVGWRFMFSDPPQTLAQWVGLWLALFSVTFFTREREQALLCSCTATITSAGLQTRHRYVCCHSLNLTWCKSASQIVRRQSVTHHVVDVTAAARPQLWPWSWSWPWALANLSSNYKITFITMQSASLARLSEKNINHMNILVWRRLSISLSACLRISAKKWKESLRLLWKQGNTGMFSLHVGTIVQKRIWFCFTQ